MQRTRTDGHRRIIFYYILPILVFATLIAVDQVSKHVLKNVLTRRGSVTVIRNFFWLSYVENKGAAWGIFSSASWGQIFLKVLTVIALIGFCVFYYFAVKKQRKWLMYALIFIIGGTIGNFIDRIFLHYVIDFLSFNFFGYDFPVFNFADCFLVVGVIMLLIYFLFMDDTALFKKKSKEENQIENEDSHAD
ncbi:MAG: signal peptidase II [Clostridia bacterium]|nr:signal peptidase II [Clostridia bacterium]